MVFRLPRLIVLGYSSVVVWLTRLCIWSFLDTPLLLFGYLDCECDRSRILRIVVWLSKLCIWSFLDAPLFLLCYRDFECDQSQMPASCFLTTSIMNVIVPGCPRIVIWLPHLFVWSFLDNLLLFFGHLDRAWDHSRMPQYCCFIISVMRVIVPRYPTIAV